MTVQELEELLARLPADMEVHVRGAGVGTFHVAQARKENRRRFTWVDGVKVFPGEGPWEHTAPALVLDAGFPRRYWFEAPPAVELLGRWPKVQEVAA